MTDPLAPLVEALKAAGEPAAASSRLATVTASDSTGILVRFDGETVASTRRYKSVGGCRTGDRVLMVRAGSSWVAVGAVGSRAEVPISRWNGGISPSVNPLPADNVLRTSHILQSACTVPAGAHTAVVSMSLTAGSSINAAALWTPLFSSNNGVTSWENLLDDRVSHNNTSANVGTGFAVTAEFDVRHIAVGQLCAVAVNGRGSGGGGAIYVGNLIWAITFKGTVA